MKYNLKNTINMLSANSERTHKKPAKWMIYGAEALLGKHVDSIAKKYNDTPKNVRDHLSHGLKQKAPSIYMYIKNNMTVMDRRKKNGVEG